MMDSTIAKAEKIITEGRVTVCKDSKPPFHLRFIVKNEEGVDVEVFRRLKEVGEALVPDWSCSRVKKEVRYKYDEETKKKEKFIHKYGCVMFVHVDKSNPFCAHTLAAKLFWEKGEIL